nr:uncharacterized protein LOC118877630 [Drosophila suzukii]
MITENIVVLAYDFQSWEDTAEVISDMAEHFTTRQQQQLFQEFYDVNHQYFGKSAAVLSKSLESVKENIAWAEDHLEGLVQYLERRNAGSIQGATSILVLLLAVVASLLAWL